MLSEVVTGTGHYHIAGYGTYRCAHKSPNWNQKCNANYTDQGACKSDPKAVAGLVGKFKPNGQIEINTQQEVA